MATVLFVVQMSIMVFCSSSPVLVLGRIKAWTSGETL
jgi:hypothetical protein